jgi:hypothetical protein
MDEAGATPHTEATLGIVRKPWRRPTLERLNANSAGVPPGKTGNTHDNATPQPTLMS